MRKRFLLILAVSGPLAILAALLMPQFQSLWPGVTPWRFSNLHRGMEETEVVAILGKSGEPGARFTGSYYKTWWGKDCHITIRFNGYGAESGTLRFKDGSTVELREQPWSGGQLFLLCLGLVATALAFVLHFKFLPWGDQSAFAEEDVLPRPCPDHAS
jgi:hypothetical protein